ncbi:MAG TPA: phospho-N-acetylmuramoyl-pentapeptide-transferase [Bryobacteraceae bacterium]|jgi:phospho-N-acetylmuramoyl-pentapeptide-transferase|nr:phospho-N-acetylmuramoyl-pentapeptide-transferase [Bryobacteraceae bacterium]
MLYWLLFQKLSPVVGPFRVFRYVTSRTMFASLTSLFLCIMLGPWMIRRLRELHFGQQIREDGPKSHMKKAGTPTMGGVLIVISIVVPTLLWADLTQIYVWIAMFGLVAFGVIGFIDDYAKITNKRNLGLTAKKKFALQMLVAALITAVLAVMQFYGQYTTTLNVPFIKQFQPDFLIHSLMRSPFTYMFAFLPFYLFFVFVVVGSSNAVNITDGLDGLAIGLMVIAAGALTVLCYTSGNRELATYLLLTRNPRTAELTIFCASMTGASLGFLWWNAHPADVFMGDVGSLSLGGAMGVVAVLIKQEILLICIAGMFVVELMSVILQVGSYKLRKKRIFKMAPIHHHFEALGWDESKIIARFWIAGFVMALFALTTLKLR